MMKQKKFLVPFLSLSDSSAVQNRVDHYSRFSLFANMRIISKSIREYSRIMRIILRNSKTCPKVQKLVEGNAKKSLLTTIKAHFEQNLAKSRHCLQEYIL